MRGDIFFFSFLGDEAGSSDQTLLFVLYSFLTHLFDLNWSFVTQQATFAW